MQNVPQPTNAAGRIKPGTFLARVGQALSEYYANRPTVAGAQITNVAVSAPQKRHSQDRQGKTPGRYRRSHGRARSANAGQFKPRTTTLDDVRKETGLSDLEITDAYNDHYGTSWPSPLEDKLLPQARHALRLLKEQAA